MYIHTKEIKLNSLETRVSTQHILGNVCYILTSSVDGVEGAGSAVVGLGVSGA